MWYKMNRWVKKSIDLADSEGYLDRLEEIYRVEPAERQVSQDILDSIEKVYDTKDPVNLVKTLLKLKIEKFPIDHPFIAFLKRSRSAVEKNPKTVKKIGEALLSMSLDQIFNGLKKPKMASRRMGPMFRNWLPNLGYPLLEEDEILTYKKTAILKGSDKTLMKFVNKNLGCNEKKGIDLVVKTPRTYIIGEAKFLSDVGGEQYEQFSKALDFAEKKEGRNTVRIAILDGVVWIKSKNKMYKEIVNTKATALSALLLKEFIESHK